MNLLLFKKEGNAGGANGKGPQSLKNLLLKGEGPREMYL
jgi:hypothetical protein